MSYCWPCLCFSIVLIMDLMESSPTNSFTIPDSFPLYLLGSGIYPVALSFSISWRLIYDIITLTSKLNVETVSIYTMYTQILFVPYGNMSDVLSFFFFLHIISWLNIRVSHTCKCCLIFLDQPPQFRNSPGHHYLSFHETYHSLELIERIFCRLLAHSLYQTVFLI